MPRTPRIRWTDAQVKRLDTAVRRYNAALSYARRTRPQDAEFLPSTASSRKLRSEITSARELNNVVNSLNRGGSASAFRLVQTRSGEVMSRWRLREAQIAFSVQERRKAVERKKRGLVNSRGEIKTGNMGTIAEYNLAPAQRTPADMTADQIDRLLNRNREASRVNEYDRALSFYDNYMEAMENSGFLMRFPETASEILNIIREIRENDPSFLLRVYESYDESLRIDFVYDDNLYMTLRIVEMRDGWRNAYSDWLASRES